MKYAKIRLDTIIDHKHRILRTLDFIESHLDQCLNVRSLSKVACFSDFHFHRLFKNYVGETVSGYIRLRRLAQAGTMLAQSRIKITDLAYSIGYDTPESFAKAFKKAFGTSPSEFRNIEKQIQQRRPDQVAPAILLIPLGISIGEITHQGDIGKRAFSELERMGDQVDLQETASTWISVFPSFYSEKEIDDVKKSSQMIQIGPLLYCMEFIRADAQFHVLESGQSALLSYHTKNKTYRKDNSVIPFTFKKNTKTLGQPPLQIRSILCIPHLFQNHPHKIP